MEDSYLTIAARVQAEIKIERSRFIGTAVPVVSRANAEEEYGRIRKQYYDATHNCFAFVAGRGTEQTFRYSDDGEPSGTAGKQIHESITSRNLTDVLVVVTRYYGGVKLGTGGLSRAYRESANAALDQAKVIERFLMRTCRLAFSHEQVSTVMRVLSEFGLKPLATDYGEQVELTVEIRLGLYENLRKTIMDRTHGKIKVATLEANG